MKSIRLKMINGNNIRTLTDSDTKNTPMEMPFLKLTFFVLRILGLRTAAMERKSKLSKAIGFVHRLLPYAFMTYCSFYVILLLRSLKFDSSFTMATASLASFTIWLTSSIFCVGYFLRWDKTDFSRHYFALLSNATGFQALKSKKRLMQIRYLVHTIASSIYFCLSVFNIAAGVFWPGLRHWKELDEKTIGIVFGVRFFDYVSLAMIAYASIVWCSATTFFVFFAGLLREEFLILQNRQKQKQDVWTADCVYSFSRTYFALCSAVEFLDSAFAWFLFYMLCADIGLITFLSYTFLTSCCDRDVVEYIAIALWTTFAVFQLLACSMAPARLHEAAVESAKVIPRTLTCEDMGTNDELYKAATWFTQKVVSQPTGITCGGFCLITKPLLLTVASVFLTYLTLLVQLHGPTYGGIRNDTGTL